MEHQPWTASFHLILINCIQWLLLMSPIQQVTSNLGNWAKSEVSQTVGHYPGSYCQITDLMLIPEGTTGTFYSTNPLNVSETCINTERVWTFDNRSDLRPSDCDETFDEGHIFIFFYYYGQSNYFHLHYDTAIPLYKAIFRPPVVEKGHWEREKSLRRAFFPTVEVRRLEKTYWETDAFAPKHADKYWADIIKTIVGNHGNHTFLPLDKSLLAANKTLCFRKAFFGTPSWKNDHPTIVNQFIRHVERAFDVYSTDPEQTKIGIVHRAGRRKILNEADLVEGLRELAPTDLVNFDGLSFKEQVMLMQEYQVLIAMNGAGLMNCLYLPPSSVCIQLVPYKAQLNFGPYGDLLKMRGPYLEWHNTHEESHFHRGQGSHNDDTIVQVTELKELVREALTISQDLIERSLHDEL